MKVILPLALALGACAAAPAAAKETPPSALRLGPALVKAAGPANAALVAKDPGTAEPLVAQAEAAASNDDERYVAAVLRYRLESAKLSARQLANPNAPADETALAKPLDALISSPVTPKADKAQFYRARAQLAFNSRQYPVAVSYFGKARELGDADPEIALFLLKARTESGDVAGAETELQRIAASLAAEGKKAPEDYYRYLIAHAKRAGQRQDAVKYLNAYAAAYPNSKTWYEVGRVYGLQQDAVVTLDAQQKLDLYRLLRASGAMADQYLYLEYAQAARAAEAPAEAQGVLREGIAAGKLQATDAPGAVVKAKGSPARAKSPSGAQGKVTAGAGGAGASAADVSLAQGAYAKAAELYRPLAGQGGAEADTANTRLGIALARAGDKAGALAAFAAVRGAPRSDIAQFWTTWLSTNPG